MAELRNRPLDAGPYSYVWLDALFHKVREGGRVVSVATVIATGVNADGHREILGVDISTTEDGAGWGAFLRGLVARGLSGVALVISDAHSGLVEAIEATLPGVSWQRCRIHAMRNLLAKVPRSAPASGPPRPPPVRPPAIGVVGPAEAVTAGLGSIARAVGRLLGERGAILITGGLGGVMEEAAKGAREAGGVVVGILPGDRPEEANPNVTVVVATGMGELRNGLVVRASQAIVAVGGSWGTLSEVALARRMGTPVVALEGWQVLDAGGAAVGGVVQAATPEEAVGAVWKAIEAG